jgi:hypothetical protein
MKLVKQSEVIETVKKSLDNALSAEQIGHINDMLTDATFKYSCGASSNLCISKSDIPGDGESYSLQLLASMLAGAGWKATYKYEQRDGEWIVVDLPKVDR